MAEKLRTSDPETKGNSVTKLPPIRFAAPTAMVHDVLATPVECSATDGSISARLSRWTTSDRAEDTNPKASNPQSWTNLERLKRMRAMRMGFARAQMLTRPMLYGMKTARKTVKVTRHAQNIAFWNRPITRPRI